MPLYHFALSLITWKDICSEFYVPKVRVITSSRISWNSKTSFGMVSSSSRSIVGNRSCRSNGRKCSFLAPSSACTQLTINCNMKRNFLLGKVRLFQIILTYTRLQKQPGLCLHTLLCLNIGTHTNKQFSIQNKWKINDFWFQMEN